MDRDAIGFAIALAWPQTWCKQAGSWYEAITRVLGFNHNGYYKAGHAAIVLVDPDGTCHYFDFGRYHAPFGHGRVRSSFTDPELSIRTRATLRELQILNLQDILTELAGREACHGTGDLHASYFQIQHEKAYAFARHLQKISPIPYGPFIWRGTNCSRFVRKVLVAGRPDVKTWLKLKLPYTLTPSPITNVKALPNYRVISTTLAVQTRLPSINQKGVLPAPSRPGHLPDTAYWLAGEGAGSWFTIRKAEQHFEIARYDPEGKLEFNAEYSLLTEGFDHKYPFELLHLSHFQKINVLQSGVRYLFVRLMSSEITF